jgi:hypothetical protein
MEFLSLIEREPSVKAAGAHMMAVALPLAKSASELEKASFCTLLVCSWLELSAHVRSSSETPE